MSPHPCQLTIFFLIRPSEQGTAGRHDLVESQSVDRYRSNSRRRKCAANLVVGYMSYKQYRTPFWRRTTPLPKRDILKLRPSTSKKGNRFETKRDAQIESERSELLLEQAGSPGRAFAKTLANCREGGQNCDQPFCPLCARVFRRWYIGELLRITGAARKPITVFTVLLKKAPHNKIDDLDLEKHRDSLRQRLLRAGTA
jgi:hypothetical protein